MRSTRLALIAIAATLGLAGCRTEQQVTSRQLVYINSDECATAGVLTEAECATAIAKAVVIHETTATQHKRLTDCETAEGVDRCERGDDQKWRPRPAGYLFTQVVTTTMVKPEPVVEKVVTAVALYPGKGATAVYRTAEGTILDPDKPAEVLFSRAAERRVEGFLPYRRGRS